MGFSAGQNVSTRRCGSGMARDTSQASKWSDTDLSLYLIPSTVIAGRVGLLLRTYTRYIVGSAAGLMAPDAA
jgi:hypothetical protein